MPRIPEGTRIPHLGCGGTIEVTEGVWRTGGAEPVMVFGTCDRCLVYCQVDPPYHIIRES